LVALSVIVTIVVATAFLGVYSEDLIALF